MSTNPSRRFRFLLQPTGKLRIAAGIRTFILFLVPIIIGELTFYPEIGLYIGLAGYPIILADVGGLYLTRSRMMIAIAATAVAAMFIGTLVSHLLYCKILLAFLWIFACGYAGFQGYAGVMAGIVCALFFIFAINLPSGDFWLATMRATVVLVGSAWAIFLSLIMWSVAPYQPVRKAVSQCYSTIAKYSRVFEEKYFLAKNLDQLHSQKVVELRQTVEQARDALAINRRSRLGRSTIGELACILIETADSLITDIFTLIELVEVHHHFSQFVTVNILIKDILEQIGIVNHNIARLIVNKRAVIDLGFLDNLIKALKQQKELQQSQNIQYPEDYPGFVALGKLIIKSEKVLNHLKFSTEIAYQIKNDYHPQDRKLPQQNIYYKSQKLVWLETIQDNFTFKSSLFRHSLRLAITTTIGIIIYSVFNISKGFWISLATILVLQPDFGNTYQRFWHRIIGTILGALLAPFIFSFIKAEIILQAISILSISIALSVLRFHNGIGIFFISIFVIILESFNENIDIYEIVLTRLFCTCLGAILAVIGAFVLFRDRQQQKLVSDLATAIECSLNYFSEVMNTHTKISPPSPVSISQLRKKNRLAYFNAQASLQRLSSEPQSKTLHIEPAIAVLSYLHLFTRSVTVVFTQLDNLPETPLPPELTNYINLMEFFLSSLVDSLRKSQIPSELPDLDSSFAEILANFSEKQLVMCGVDGSNQQPLNNSCLEYYTFLITELGAMSQRLQGIHSAITRLEIPS